VFLVKYELGFYITEDGLLHSHRRENLKSCTDVLMFIGTAGCAKPAREFLHTEVI
jgi:hypothetical protein